MMLLTNLAEYLQEMLNDNEYGFTFRVFDSVGKYEEGVRLGTNQIYKFINVVLSQNSCDISTLKNGTQIQTMGVTLSYLVPMEDIDNDIVQKELQKNNNDELVEVDVETQSGNATIIEDLEAFFSEFFGHPFHFNIGIDNKNYTTMMLFNNPAVADRDIFAGVGFATTFSQSGFVYLVEDGINERNLDWYLDGNLIPYDSATQFRNPTINGYVDKEGNGEVENTELQYQKTWAFVFPSMLDSLGEGVIRYLNGNNPNMAHFLKHEVHLDRGVDNADAVTLKFYDLVLFGQSSMQAQVTKNASFSVSLVSCTKDFSILDFPSGFILYDVQNTTASVAKSALNNNILGWDTDTKTFIDFGDGLAHDVSGMLFVSNGKITGLSDTLIRKEY